MWQRLRVVSALWLCSLAYAAPTVAQSQNASVAGTVRDATGAVLPGVTVEVASPALIEKVRTTTTDEAGAYRVIELRPGVYTVSFVLPGFSAVRREGIELRANFTATIDAELKVGGVEETITVSGQSPVVDVQNVVQQVSLSRDYLDAVPSGSKTPLSLAAFIPAAIVPPNAQDVGGSRGEQSARLAIHGSTQRDQKLMVDGMRFNNLVSDGTGRGFFMNPGSSEEMVIAMGTGGSAEYSTGGVQINLIPKDGGNRFSGYFYTNYTDHNLQSDNLSDDLRQRGLTSVTELRELYDVNGALGGPLRRDRVWFYSAHRRWGDTNRAANLFYNATQGTPVHTPDPSRPADAYNWYKSHNLRVTSQATQKDKISLFYDWQDSCNCFGPFGVTSATAIEAQSGLHFTPQYLAQATWTRPHSPKLLFEAGISLMKSRYSTYRQPGVSESDVSILELSRNFRYNAPVSFGYTDSSQSNQRFSVSYVTGTHNVKVGLFMLEGWHETNARRATSEVSYTFFNGVPTQLTLYANNITTRQEVGPELGLFVQDQWRIGPLTLNYGLRYDYIRAFVPANEQPAGRFVQARRFEEVDCVPCWHDLAPRFAASYDLFGNGKTAVKGSVSRYVQAQTVSIASVADPVNASVNNVNRPWTDLNGNFVPDCDLRNPQAHTAGDFCGQYSNLNFGSPNVTTRYDPDLITGWQNRPYNWQISGTIEHELFPGVAVNGGYFRTWYGNFTVTDNLEVTPTDFDEFCITAPADARLGDASGQRICGLYNVHPTRAGRVNNLVTFASRYGEQRNVYNGVDAGFSARLPRGVQLNGGVNVGNAISTAAYDGVSSTSRCFVVDSPEELRFCEQPIPYRSQFKVSGTYPLPWDTQVSGSLQSLPGISYLATYNARNAEVAPSLNRNLSGGAQTVAVQLVRPFTLWESRFTQVDVRAAKTFRARRVRFQATFDVYNLFNANPVLSMVETYGQRWQEPTLILTGRMIKFGGRMEF